MTFISSQRKSNRKNSTTVATLKCDECHAIVVRRDKRLVFETQKFHFCSHDCQNKSMTVGRERSQIFQYAQESWRKEQGITNTFQLPALKEKRYQSLLLNSKRHSSKAEDNFFTFMCDIIPSSNIDRMNYIHDSITDDRWFIDFRIISENVYIQFDGVYWHGLDRPYDQLEERIKATFQKDRRQDQWAIENNIVLLRFTDVEFQKNKEAIQERLSTLISYGTFP